MGQMFIALVRNSDTAHLSHSGFSSVTLQANISDFHFLIDLMIDLIDRSECLQADMFPQFNILGSI